MLFFSYLSLASCTIWQKGKFIISEFCSNLVMLTPTGAVFQSSCMIFHDISVFESKTLSHKLLLLFM